ncbi:MAG: hypothetical protein IJT00_10550 [Lachnospiraceae bacterium]|nr:hypothetical protein [Lachnospiraceae bacterium]
MKTIFDAVKGLIKIFLAIILGLFIISFIMGVVSASLSHAVTPTEVQATSKAAETTARQTTAAPVKPLSLEEQIEAEGGVLGYSYKGKGRKLRTYVLIDTKTKMLTRANKFYYSKTAYSGDLADGILAGNFLYKFADPDDIQQLDMVLTGRDQDNKVITFQKEPGKYVENEIYDTSSWYGYYNTGFKRRVLYFGNYEADVDITNGPEPLEWLVLCEESGKTLMMTSFVLKSQGFLDTPDNTGYSWKTSEIRKWLNDDFYNTTFSDDEKKHILSTKTTLRGVTTTDKVLLVSVEQLENHFPEKIFLRVGRDISSATGVENSTSAWWTISCRSDVQKYFVDREGRIDTDSGNKKYGVRPVVWVDSSYAETLMAYPEKTE